jgi:hypothetical protein
MSATSLGLRFGFRFLGGCLRSFSPLISCLGCCSLAICDGACFSFGTFEFLEPLLSAFELFKKFFVCGFFGNSSQADERRFKFA